MPEDPQRKRTERLPDTQRKPTEKASPTDRCPECGGHLVADERRGEVSCETCGVVIEEDMLDFGPEWRAFNASERAAKERAGPPLNILQHDYGLGTVMWGRTDASGKHIRGGDLGKVRRLQRLDRRTHFKRGAERNLARALSEIKRMGTSLGVPQSVVEEAARLYRQAARKSLIRGRSIESIATACLYAAMRSQGIPRSLEEVTQVSSVKRRELGRIYKVICQELGLSLAPVSPLAFIPRFASQLELEQHAEAEAMRLARKAIEAQVLSGKDPKSIAAAAIYLGSTLSGSPRTQKEVSEVSGVTEVTIRNRYKELVEALDISFEF